MALRGKKPEAIQKRLKLLMFGPAGVGKTTAAIQFPRSYVIDTERGAENYDKALTESGSVVFQTLDYGDVCQEVKSLLSEPHEYRTLVIDSLTNLYNEMAQRAEAKVGSEFGRHLAEADKQMKRLMALIMQLDMNVVVTSHGKIEYGANFQKLGFTFDGWKKADYHFDLVIQLGRDKTFNPANPKARGAQRYARVEKTRIEAFPDQEVFEWSYKAVADRYGGELVDRRSAPIALATREQVAELKSLLAAVLLPEGTLAKWLTKANAEEIEDLPQEVIGKCIEFTKARALGASTPQA
jgi:RecA/RadA recombinase